MYRILIVDDEEIIVNGLYELLHALEDLELDVYKAYSGEEAIQWLGRTRMDIVLTDISMPEISGLMLMEEIRRRWPWCRVIFLTGHSEFQYAYEALQYQRVSYILKTEGYPKILESVRRVIAELKEETKTNELIQNAKDQIDLARDLLCQKYFQALLCGDSSLRPSREAFARLYVRLNADAPALLVIAQQLNTPEQLDFWEKNQLFYSLKQLIMRYLSIQFPCLVIPLEEERIAILIQEGSGGLGAGSAESMRLCVKGTLELIQNDAREKLDALVSFALCERACLWQEMSHAYMQLAELMNAEMNQDVENILDAQEYKRSHREVDEGPELRAAREALSEFLYRRDCHKLQQCLEKKDEEAYFEYLDRLLPPLCLLWERKELLALELCQLLGSMFLSFLNRFQLTERYERIADISALSFNPRLSGEGLKTQLLSLSRTMFLLKREAQDKRVGQTISFLQRYVEKHLSEELSLTSLSEVSFLSPAYLSRLYHQATGEKLSAFIERMRYNRAKELLAEPSEKIFEIARAVGYDSAASFTRFFKKQNGCSPQEYRDELLRRLRSRQI